jgi:hypothetical protein
VEVDECRRRQGWYAWNRRRGAMKGSGSSQCSRCKSASHCIKGAFVQGYTSRGGEELDILEYVASGLLLDADVLRSSSARTEFHDPGLRGPSSQYGP